MIEPAEVAKEERRLQGSCEVDRPFHFEFANVKENNLSGFGPMTGPQRLVFGKVGNAAKNGMPDRFFDLVVEVEGNTYSTANPGNNGVSAQIGRINVEAKVTPSSDTARTKLKFSFEDSDSGAPVSLDKIVFQFFDLDRDEKLTLKESLCINLDQVNPSGATNIPNLQFNPSTNKLEKVANNDDVSTVLHSKSCGGNVHAEGSVEVTGTKVGFGCDNPKSTNLKTVQCTDVGCFNAKNVPKGANISPSIKKSERCLWRWMAVRASKYISNSSA